MPPSSEPTDEDRIGHASIATTANVDSHDTDEAAQRVGESWGDETARRAVTLSGLRGSLQVSLGVGGGI
jgi:hypothetical protein